MTQRWIHLDGVREHNLAGFDLAVPAGALTVVTGVSGSGKSSLAFDTLFREGQRRFLETLPAFSRQFERGVGRPALAAASGLGPAVAVAQRAGLANPRSTVGTLTEIWDLLRLVYARLGQAPDGVKPSRGLFSFNGDEGACARCAGLGVEDTLDPELLVADPDRSLREGALHLSTPNGYLMYSQVTLEVLDQVLRAHGGSVDVPWRDLGAEARQALLYGSRRLKVPFGKHTLESRLTWTGITARPRQEDHYRGLLPVMEAILRGKRNDSILRYVRSVPCPDCGGRRLRPEALATRWRDRGIADLAALPAADLRTWLAALPEVPAEAPVLTPIRADLLARLELMADLGLDYLACDRPAPSLSPGEVQRLRLLTLAQGDLRGLLVVLDEPSAGLHPADAGRLLSVLRRLRDRGQTVVVVEHDATLALGADWLVDLGPGPGAAGGRLLYAGPPAGVLQVDSATGAWLRGDLRPAPRAPRAGAGLVFQDVARNNLRLPEVRLVAGGLNVVTGVSGAGKTSLLSELAGRPGAGRVVAVDALPIGRTPRSNPATYTGAFDRIRARFAATPEARARGLGKGHFTFNTAGGRCETCEGAGVLEVGMKHLGSVASPCPDCGGRRFLPEVLDVRVHGLSVADLLDASVAEAGRRFQDDPALARILAALEACGLGYLALGQPATTLSGGEAQRVKLAAELAKAGREPALILLDEPTTGLHAADVRVLMEALDRLLAAGHTLLVADNDPQVVLRADRVLDLGPGGGPRGGRQVVAGSPADLLACEGSVTGAHLRRPPVPDPAPPTPADPPLRLEGAATHNLRSLTVEIPARGLTVVTGPSGSGKSSLVFDTLLAEARNRFSDLVAPWARRFLPRLGGPELEAARDLRAAVAVPAAPGRRNPRARVGTAADLDEGYRLLFARCGDGAADLPAAAFSANTGAGACPRCRGLGLVQRCDPRRLVTHPDLPLTGGALGGTAYGAYLGEPYGRFVATLRTVGEAFGEDFDRPWRDLPAEARRLAMDGCGDRVFQVAWAYKRGRREGVHQLATPWAGFRALVEQEYERVHLDPKGEALEALLADSPCPACEGERLGEAARRVQVAGLRLPELSRLSLAEARVWFEGLAASGPAGRIRDAVLPRLRALEAAGLGHLAADREMATLSGGEAQRLRLAASLVGGLSGVAYVLDEPSRGLHPQDCARLVGVLRGLADAGNAVVVVSHEPVLVAAADQVLELGPGAGPEGGRLVHAGPPAGFPPDSVTARLLGDRVEDITLPERPRRPGVDLRGVRLHTLRGFDLDLPAGMLVAVTGVSGSGKSTLVHGVLGASLRAGEPVGCDSLRAHLRPARVESLAQADPGPGGGSDLAAAAGFGEALRRRFAATPRARELKLSARHFGTASAGGRCEACAGRGVRTIPMDLLPDVTVGCEACAGQGFLPEVLECRVEGLNLAEVRAGTLASLHTWLADPVLAALVDLGLGYLRPGQAARDLSGGEWQRLRLARLLGGMGSGPAAVLLDEPARGLGRADVARLASALDRLAGQGHLVVAVEHDLDLIQAAGWIVDLGPGGGPEGGALVAQGRPEDLAACPGSFTGQCLRDRREKPCLENSVKSKN